MSRRRRPRRKKVNVTLVLVQVSILLTILVIVVIARDKVGVTASAFVGAFGPEDVQVQRDDVSAPAQTAPPTGSPIKDSSNP